MSYYDRAEQLKHKICFFKLLSILMTFNQCVFQFFRKKRNGKKTVKHNFNLNKGLVHNEIFF